MVRPFGKMRRNHWLTCAAIAFCITALFLNSCTEEDNQATQANDTIPQLDLLFPKDKDSGPIFSWLSGSPLLVRSQGNDYILIAASNGLVAGIQPETGHQEWEVRVPVPDGFSQSIKATPVYFENKIAIAQQVIESEVRIAHRVVIVDLDERQLDADFPIIELRVEKMGADGQMVRFNPPTAQSRSSLVYGNDNGNGYLYVSFGNGRDIQPWHGWVFELDLAAWKSHGTDSAISGVLLTTPELHCPIEGRDGSRDSICGGGVWTHAGPQLYPVNGSYEILIPTGNGQLDLSRRDYAQTLMRAHPGLEFDPQCDDNLCAVFDPGNPDLPCIESCSNLFVPRLLPGDAPLNPASGACDGKTFWECLNAMDWDLGANAPAKLELADGPTVYVLAGKDGGVYLIDAEHMGTLHDRIQITESCDTPQPGCKRDWAGTIATQPTVTKIDDVPLVIIPTYMPSEEQPAGLVALKILVDDPGPYFELHWQAPDFSTEEARQTFLYHPSRVVLSRFEGEEYAWVAEGKRLLGVRVRDGKIVERQALIGEVPYDVLPLIRDNVLYIPTRKQVEAYEIK